MVEPDCLAKVVPFSWFYMCSDPGHINDDTKVCADDEYNSDCDNEPFDNPPDLSRQPSIRALEFARRKTSLSIGSGGIDRYGSGAGPELFALRPASRTYSDPGSIDTEGETVEEVQGFKKAISDGSYLEPRMESKCFEVANIDPSTVIDEKAVSGVIRAPGGEKASKAAVELVRSFAQDRCVAKRILREIRLLAHMQHENVLGLSDVFSAAASDSDDISIVTPYISTSLETLLYSRRTGAAFTETQCAGIIRRVLTGVEYLHSVDVVHHALKPSAILFGSDGSVRIKDYGLVCPNNGSSSSETSCQNVGVDCRVAPEKILLPHCEYEAVDLWAVGCIQAEILRRAPLFQGNHPCKILRFFAKALGFSDEEDMGWLLADDAAAEAARGMVRALRLNTLPLEKHGLEALVPIASREYTVFLRRCLVWNPERRISAVDALRHPFVSTPHDSGEARCVHPEPFAWKQLADDWEAIEHQLTASIYSKCARFHRDMVGFEHA